LDSPLGRPDRVDKLEQRQVPLVDNKEAAELAVDEEAEVDEALQPISRPLDQRHGLPTANPTSVDIGPTRIRIIWPPV